MPVGCEVFASRSVNLFVYKLSTARMRRNRPDKIKTCVWYRYSARHFSMYNDMLMTKTHLIIFSNLLDLAHAQNNIWSYLDIDINRPEAYLNW